MGYRLPHREAAESWPPSRTPGRALAASGLVAGEGLAGVLVAGLVAGGMVPKSKPFLISVLPGELTAVAMIVLVCLFLYRAGRRA